MRKTQSTHENHSDPGARIPLWVALAVAVFGVLAMLVIDHGPWARPRVQAVEVANYRTTGAAARAAGATVTPTTRKPEIEPDAPGPKPVEPADVPSPRS
jgi:hypothetical protein